MKTELTVRLYGELDEGTAVVSANCHRDHFGKAFKVRTAEGAVATRYAGVANGAHRPGVVARVRLAT